MSILTELKKLTKKKNAMVVSQALPDSLDGSGSGGGLRLFLIASTILDAPQAVIDAAQVYYPNALGYYYYLFNKTASEVQNAFDNGSAIWFYESNRMNAVISIYHDNNSGIYELTSAQDNVVPLVLVDNAVWTFVPQSKD